MDFHLTELIIETEEGEEIPVPCDFVFYTPFDGDKIPQSFRMEEKDAEALIRALAPFCKSVVSITPAQELG